MSDDIDFPPGDYVSPGFRRVRPDGHFPDLAVGDIAASAWPYERRVAKHNWYVARRAPSVGLLSRDEAHILYNCALAFAGRPALEIGCWLGWSACHLVLAGVQLDVIDPLVADERFRTSIVASLQPAVREGQHLRLMAGQSPSMVHKLAGQGTRWSLVFLDGNRDFPAPVTDAIAVERYCAADALILFRGLLSPHVAEGLRYLQDRGWRTRLFPTLQIMGAAWRGDVVLPSYEPDASAQWEIPPHLGDWA